MIKRCAICGNEFEAVGRNSTRQIYCSKACRRTADNERLKKYRSSHNIDKPIPYSPKHAQDTHNRQADIERKARAAGLSYGKYQMLKYMERIKEAEG